MPEYRNHFNRPIIFLFGVFVTLVSFQNCGKGFQVAPNENLSSLDAQISGDLNGDLSIYVRDTSVLQGETLKFKFELSKASSKEIEINFKTVDETAIAGSDYLLESSSSVKILPGEQFALLEIKTLAEHSNDIPKKLNMEIMRVSSGSIGQKTAIGTIRPLKQIFEDKGVRTCITTDQNTLKCRGSNEGGSLGNGVSTASEQFVDVINLENVRQVVMGNTDHVCALTFEGTVKCWGKGFSSIPQEIVGINNATQISAGDSSTCALTADGSVWCWGFFLSARGLGGGNTKVPQKISGLTDTVQIAHGGYHACALNRNGTVKCWGQDAQRGYFVKSDTPIDMGFSGIKQISTNYDTLAVLTEFDTLKVLQRSTIPYELPITEKIGSLSTSGIQAPICFVNQAKSLTCLRGTNFEIVDIEGATSVMRASRECFVNANNVAKCFNLYGQTGLSIIE